MTDEYDVAIFNEFQELGNQLVSDKTWNLDEFIDAYETFRDTYEEVTGNHSLMELDDDNSVEGFKDTIVNIIHHNIGKAVEAVYNEAREKLTEATSYADKFNIITEAKCPLERFAEFPEHSNHPRLIQVLRILDEFEVKLDIIEAERAELEWKELVKNINYTATDKQIKYLLALGAKPHQLDGIDKKTASTMISRLLK